MFQQREHRLTFTAEQSAAQRLDAIQQALIAQRVVRQHALYLQAPGYDELHIGAWPDVLCSDADLQVATGVLISW